MVGTVVWGHITSIDESFSRALGNGSGTGTISGSGDAETLTLYPGQYWEFEDWETGTIDIRLQIDKYLTGSGGAPTVKYKTTATQGGLPGAGWVGYSGDFSSFAD